MERNDIRFMRYKKLLLTLIFQHLPTCTVYLFGSRARGTNRPGADIDLALDYGHPLDFSTLAKIYTAIDDTTLPLSVDLVDLYTASDQLKNEVKKEGIIWEL